MRALLVLLAALLLLFAPIAAGIPPAVASDGVSIPGSTDGFAAGSVDAPPDAASVHESNLTYRVLSTPAAADRRVGSLTRTADLGTSLGLAVGDADAALRTETAIQRIEAAETTAERERRLADAFDRINRAEASLERRQAAAITAHAAGELSDRELLDELVRIAAVAEAHDRRLGRLGDLADETDEFSSPEFVAELRLRLQVYRGPVRAVAAETLRAGDAGAEIRVESSPNALVLATVHDGQYVRESVRHDRWDRPGEPISSEAAIDVTSESYPETTALREPNAFGAGSIQRVTVPHEFGELRTFVSGGTERVFAEHQRVDLATFPDVDPVSTTGDGFDVTVNRTYPGGPITVTVVDAETGAPIPDITVTRSVGDDGSEAIGDTDETGVVRTLSPGQPYRITVVDEPRVAVIDEIRPTPTPRLADDAGGSDANTTAVDTDPQPETADLRPSPVR